MKSFNIFKDFTGYSWFYYYSFKKTISGSLSKAIFKFQCFLKGIHTGRQNAIYGIPKLRRHPFSKINIGNGCRFNSSYSSTEMGIYKRCRLVTVSKSAVLSIGNNVGISGATILSENNINIEDNVLIGAHSIIIDTDRHNIQPGKRLISAKSKPIHIRKNVWLGMNCTVLKGVEIGENSVIGANSLVTKSIPSNVIAGGNPCKVIKKIV